MLGTGSQPSLSRIGPAAPAQPRHVRVGFRRYSALQGIDLTPLKTWRGRVVSMEALVSTLVNSLRRRGFRPFRPLEESRKPSDSTVECRITGLRDVAVRLRLPWQPGQVTCALSIDLKGRRLLQKKLHGFSARRHQVIYDATVSITGGVGVFKGRQWRTVRRAKVNRLALNAVDHIIGDLENAATPNGAAENFFFDRPDPVYG